MVSDSMLTLFTTAKPFRGHTGIIQRNAIQSWTRLDTEIEIILFGNDEGAAEATQKFGVRHEPHVECNDRGTKRLDYMFARAQAIPYGWPPMGCRRHRAPGVRRSACSGSQTASARLAGQSSASLPTRSCPALRLPAHRRMDRLLRLHARPVRGGHAPVRPARLLGQLAGVESARFRQA